MIAEARMPVSFNGSDGQTVDAVALEPASGASADDGTQAQPSDLSSTGSLLRSSLCSPWRSLRWLWSFWPSAAIVRMRLRKRMKRMRMS